MLNAHPELKQPPSQDVLNGEKFQNAVADTIPNIIGQEMRGKYQSELYGVTINFSNDIVCPDKIIEVKSVRQPYPDWYLHSSILQCAFYKSMMLLGARHLETASFYVNLGNKRVTTEFGDETRSIKYILIFGEEKYEILVDNPYQIVSFFEYKAACCNDWTSAKRWDEKYKHREWDMLKNNIKYINVF